MEADQITHTRPISSREMCVLTMQTIFSCRQRPSCIIICFVSAKLAGRKKKMSHF
jgi:hypothetical protein